MEVDHKTHPCAREGEVGEFSVRVDLVALRSRFEPLATPHGVELVAVEWMQGPGRGLLRLTIDLPEGDPRQNRLGITADHCALVSRAVSTSLDETDFTELPYDLEVSSPGLERPLQLRHDFDRFVGLSARLRVKTHGGGRATLDGVLLGTEDPTVSSAPFTVKLGVRGDEQRVSSADITRAHLVEIPAPAAPRPSRARATKPQATKAEAPTSGGREHRPR